MCNFVKTRMYRFPKWLYHYAATAKSLQSCLTLCNPIDSSPPGSAVPGILQARTLEWVAISISNAWKWKVKGKSLSRVRLLATPCTAAYQAPPSMGFSRQEYLSGLPLPSPAISYWGDFSQLRDQTCLLHWEAGSLPLISFTWETVIIHGREELHNTLLQVTIYYAS